MSAKPSCCGRRFVCRIKQQWPHFHRIEHDPHNPNTRGQKATSRNQRALPTAFALRLTETMNGVAKATRKAAAATSG